jgi:3-hydroxybutyryl-CoA dehydrogenase
MQNISVIGSGTMGNGIAHVFAQNGYKVSLIDINQAALDRALATIAKNLDRMVAKEKITAEDKASTLANISTHTDIAGGVKYAELVIEAATENKDLKFKIFGDMDVYAPAGCILASNTSSISITELAAQTNRPDKVIGMHFMNPVPVMLLVEIINGYNTSKEVTAIIDDLSRKIGKVPAMANDYPGFIANRILMPMINEAIETLFQGIGSIEGIDAIMKGGMRHPMGPLQLADFIGLDVCLSILNVLYDGFKNPKYAPCPLLINMVNSGLLGVKSKAGFYLYTDLKNPIVNPSIKI